MTSKEQLVYAIIKFLNCETQGQLSEEAAESVEGELMSLNLVPGKYVLVFLVGFSLKASIYFHRGYVVISFNIGEA